MSTEPIKKIENPSNTEVERLRRVVQKQEGINKALQNERRELNAEIEELTKSRDNLTIACKQLCRNNDLVMEALTRSEQIRDEQLSALIQIAQSRKAKDARKIAGTCLNKHSDAVARAHDLVESLVKRAEQLDAREKWLEEREAALKED